MKITIEFEIPDNSLELLERLNKEGFAEFKDVCTLEKYLKEHYLGFNSIKGKECTEKYYRRNFCDIDKIYQLENVGFVKSDDMAWHLTYVITEEGLKFLNKNKN